MSRMLPRIRVWKSVYHSAYTNQCLTSTLQLREDIIEVRATQQGMDQGKDLHPAEEAGRQVMCPHRQARRDVSWVLSIHVHGRPPGRP